MHDNLQYSIQLTGSDCYIACESSDAVSLEIPESKILFQPFFLFT